MDNSVDLIDCMKWTVLVRNSTKAHMKKKDGLSRSVYSRNAVPSNLSHQKGPRTYKSTGESYQTMKEEATPLLYTLFQKTEERTHLIF